MDIDSKRLRRNILDTAEFGAIDSAVGRGRTLLTGSEADGEAREYLIDALEAAGMTVRIDPVGNIAGRWTPDSVEPDTPAIALGSHLDSVPRGGIFDGPLGVYAGLEAVRAIRASDRSVNRPLEVVSFTEEEGARFGIGTLGSSVATGELSVSEALELEDDGLTLEDQLSSIGFRGRDQVNPAAWSAWLELHIEQGTRLESAGTPVGIVDAVTGITNVHVEVVGESDHAGTTPMEERSDALVAAGSFVQRVDEAASDIAAEHPAAVATVGEHAIEPNVRNVIPGRVEMELDIRGVTRGTMDALVSRIRSAADDIAAAHPVETSAEQYRHDPPTKMSDACLDAASAAADATNVTAQRLHSAAMHDTATVSEVADAGLLFAPSRDGVSHTPKEWTEWEDCAAATRVLAGAAARLAGGEPR